MLCQGCKKRQKMSKFVIQDYEILEVVSTKYFILFQEKKHFDKKPRESRVWYKEFGKESDKKGHGELFI